MDKAILALSAVTIAITIIFIFVAVANAINQSKLLRIWTKTHEDWITMPVTVEAVIECGFSCTYVLDYKTYHTVIQLDKLESKAAIPGIGDTISILLNPNNTDDFVVDVNKEQDLLLKTKLYKATKLLLTIIFMLCILIAAFIGTEVIA